MFSMLEARMSHVINLLGHGSSPLVRRLLADGIGIGSKPCVALQPVQVTAAEPVQSLTGLALGRPFPVPCSEHMLPHPLILAVH